MKFNKLIPELTVFNIEETREFYISTLGFQLEHERAEEKFMFVSLEDTQFMFEELHKDGWLI